IIYDTTNTTSPKQAEQSEKMTVALDKKRFGPWALDDHCGCERATASSTEVTALSPQADAWVLCQEVGTDRSTFADISLWGKFRGLHACGGTFPHMVPLPNIFL